MWFNCWSEIRMKKSTALNEPCTTFFSWFSIKVTSSNSSSSYHTPLWISILCFIKYTPSPPVWLSLTIKVMKVIFKLRKILCNYWGFALALRLFKAVSAAVAKRKICIERRNWKDFLVRAFRMNYEVMNWYKMNLKKSCGFVQHEKFFFCNYLNWSNSLHDLILIIN